jgi:hypothetical protein
VRESSELFLILPWQNSPYAVLLYTSIESSNKESIRFFHVIGMVRLDYTGSHSVSVKRGSILCNIRNRYRRPALMSRGTPTPFSSSKKHLPRLATFDPRQLAEEINHRASFNWRRVYSKKKKPWRLTLERRWTAAT